MSCDLASSGFRFRGLHRHRTLTRRLETGVDAKRDWRKREDWGKYFGIPLTCGCALVLESGRAFEMFSQRNKRGHLVRLRALQTHVTMAGLLRRCCANPSRAVSWPELGSTQYTVPTTLDYLPSLDGRSTWRSRTNRCRRRSYIPPGDSGCK